MAKIVSLQLHRAKRELPTLVDSVIGRVGGGFEGDSHVAKKTRSVLVVDRSTLDDLGLRPGDLREQVTVEGMRELDGLAPGTYLRAGGITLHVNGPCKPCTHIGEMLGVSNPEQLRQMLVGRRGVTCTVVAADDVARLGDALEVLDLPADLTAAFETYRRELTGLAYRMLGSPFDAGDAVQETFVRAWKGRKDLEGRAALRTWLYRIATNICLTMLEARKRRARPLDLGPSVEPVVENLRVLPAEEWVEPIPDGMVADPDPSEVAVARESIRLVFVAALQTLPPRQRAVLILCEVLQWKASEVAELLETSVASVNSALQLARATLQSQAPSLADPAPALDEKARDVVDRFAAAFERCDIEELTKLIKIDAKQSMPPYDMWLLGREDILRWWFGPGSTCKDSRLVRVSDANGRPAFGHYRPVPGGEGYGPWSFLVLEPGPDGIAEFTFFLETERLFPLFGLRLKPHPEQRGPQAFRLGQDG